MSQLLKLKTIKHHFTLNQLLEGVGSILGVAGALFMAVNAAEFAKIAFPIWLISSILLAWFAKRTNLNFLFMLQLTFVAVNLMGIYTNILT